MVSPETIAFLEVFLFPGFLFIFVLAFFTEWLDRKIAAKLQNRYGPLHIGPKGILQPLADFLKLLSKEDIIPSSVDKASYGIIPVIMLAVSITPIFCIPIISQAALVSFEGDLIAIMFIMSLTPLLKIIAGWVSTNRFSVIGGIRAGLQMFGYEIPMFLVLIGPSLVTHSLSISGIVGWQSQEIPLILIQPIGFIILSFCLLAHLDKIPFDMSEAESEIVGGWLVEFSGKKLAMIHLANRLEFVLGTSILVSLFLGGLSNLWFLDIILYLVKLIICVFILSNLRVLFARFRIDQFLSTSWKYLVPIALLQLSIIIIFIW